MNKNETKSPWIGYLEWECLDTETPGGFRVYEVVVKVRPAGLLAIIKARKADKFIVTFTGARSLVGLGRDVRDKINDPASKWKEDEYK